jgi:hypothetical protein
MNCPSPKRLTLTRQIGKPCPFCDQPMSLDDKNRWPTRDHYPTPKSHGGRRTIVCCHLCNLLKGDMTKRQWREWRDATPRWWEMTRLERRRHHRELARARRAAIADAPPAQSAPAHRPTP